eukprot:CAMPEP_0185266658 /NCGR_PEP_ID=MMETSP1359-20130426/31826_1 /TAXON_ID=552665 /ORGANISM="Bigelowiella longifila, Strain CCMP242" /LENGTH=239 /DNA_ID=CAMNT_0027856575 /DNA_START=3 /DNA_END=722 /DNA_ORIENTATION=+
MKDYSYVDVIVHPGVIERSGKEMAFKLYLCEVAVTHVEEDHKLTISRGYQLENELKYKGEKLQNLGASKKTPPFGIPPMSKTGATAAAPNSGIVMPEIFARKLGSEASSSSSSSSSSAQARSAGNQQAAGKRRPLIEDITMEGARDHGGGKKGKFSVEYKFDGGDTAADKKAASVIVKIHLDVVSARDINADVSSSAIKIDGCGYQFAVPLKYAILHDKAQARFSKKKRILTIKAQCVR